MFFSIINEGTLIKKSDDFDKKEFDFAKKMLKHKNKFEKFFEDKNLRIQKKKETLIAIECELKNELNVLYLSNKNIYIF